MESLFTEPINQKTLERIIKALNWIQDYDCEILTRYTAEMSGVIPPNGEKTYTDEKTGMQRTKIKYIDLDGKVREEPADIVNKKKRKKQAILKPRFTGGIAVSWLSNPSGEINPVYTGQQAKNMKTKDDDYHAIKDEIERMKEEYKSKNRKLKKMEKERDEIIRERDELEEDVKEYAESNERMRTLYSKKRMQTKAEKARADMLETKLETIKDKSDEFEEEIQEAIKNSRVKIKEKMKSEAEAEPNTRTSTIEGLEQGPSSFQETEESESEEEEE